MPEFLNSPPFKGLGSMRFFFLMSFKKFCSPRLHLFDLRNTLKGVVQDFGH